LSAETGIRTGSKTPIPLPGSARAWRRQIAIAQHAPSSPPPLAVIFAGTVLPQRSRPLRGTQRWPHRHRTALRAPSPRRQSDVLKGSVTDGGLRDLAREGIRPLRPFRSTRTSSSQCDAGTQGRPNSAPTGETRDRHFHSEPVAKAMAYLECLLPFRRHVRRRFSTTWGVESAASKFWNPAIPCDASTRGRAGCLPG